MISVHISMKYRKSYILSSEPNEGFEFIVTFKLYHNVVSVPQTRSFDWRLSVQGEIEKPHWIIFGFQTDKLLNQEKILQCLIIVI